LLAQRHVSLPDADSAVLPNETSGPGWCLQWMLLLTSRAATTNTAGLDPEERGPLDESYSVHSSTLLVCFRLAGPDPRNPSLDAASATGSPG